MALYQHLPAAWLRFEIDTPEYKSEYNLAQKGEYAANIESRHKVNK
jgi:hypothetical protein